LYHVDGYIIFYIALPQHGHWRKSRMKGCWAPHKKSRLGPLTH